MNDGYTAQAALRLAQSGTKYSPSLAAANPYLGNAASAAGIVGGLQQGGWRGDTTAAVNAGKLVGKLTDNSGLSQAAGSANNLMQIYNGLQQGGIKGYAGAAANGAQLAGNMLGNAALSSAGGYIAAPLAVYNAIDNWQSGKTGSNTLNGASAGAAVGSIVPGVGTLIGGLVGGAVGALSSAFGPGAKDPETAGVQKLLDVTGANGNNSQIAASVQNPYLALAGLMDRRESTLPMYQQYGRMGEQKFTNDMVGQINSAVSSGAMTKNADGSVSFKTDANGLNPKGAGTVTYSAKQAPAAVYAQVVAPWVDKMGSGYKNVGSTYTSTTQGLLQDMVGQYMSGQAQQNWKAIGGDSPFADLTPFGVAPGATTGGNTPARTTVPQRIVNGAGRGTQMRARGGRIRKTHYDDGGSYDSGTTTTFDPTAWEGDYGNTLNSQLYTAPDFTYNTDPTMIDLSGQLDQSNPYSAISQEMGDGSYIDAYNDPYAYGATPSGDTSSAAGSTASALSSLLKQLGISGSTASSLAPYAALLPALSSLLGGNKGSSTPSLPSQYSGQVLNIPTPANSRTATNPSMPMSQWLTAGQRPEMSFYNNNAIPATAMSDPKQIAAQAAAAAAPSGSAAPSGAATVPGGSAMQQALEAYGYNGNPYGAFSGQMGGEGAGPASAYHMALAPLDPTQFDGSMTTQPFNGPRPMMRAAGGSIPDPYTSAAATGDIGHVKGPGDGTSDSIKLRNAYLSDGEYVVDAPTVSLLGNGSNDAGARKLDQIRQDIRKHSGKVLAKGKQPMRAKNINIQAYMGGSI